MAWQMGAVITIAAPSKLQLQPQLCQTVSCLQVWYYFMHCNDARWITVLVSPFSACAFPFLNAQVLAVMICDTHHQALSKPMNSISMLWLQFLSLCPPGLEFGSLLALKQLIWYAFIPLQAIHVCTKSSLVHVQHLD